MPSEGESNKGSVDIRCLPANLQPSGAGLCCEGSREWAAQLESSIRGKTQYSCPTATSHTNIRSNCPSKDKTV